MMFTANPDGSPALADPITITCRVCARALPLEMMARDKSKPHGRTTICLECKRAADREKRAARLAAGLCQYSTGCPEPAVPGRGGRCAEHAATAAASAAAARAANPERRRESDRAARARYAARTAAEIAADLAAVLAASPDGLLPCKAGHRAPAQDFGVDRTRRSGRQACCRAHAAESAARRRSEGRARRHASWEARDLFGCAYCGAPFEDAEHVVARTAEGSPGDVDLNTVPSCWRCNRGPGGKHTTPVDEWLDRLAATGDPRGVARETWADWPRIYLAALDDGTVVDLATGEVVEEAE